MEKNRLITEFFFEKQSFEEVSKVAKSLEETGVKTMLLPPDDRNINTHLIVEMEDKEKAKSRLVELGIPAKEKEVMLITLENKPGTMAETVMRVSQEGINLTYAFSVAVSPTTSYFLLASEDNEKALAVLNK